MYDKLNLKNIVLTIVKDTKSNIYPSLDITIEDGKK